MSLKSLAQLSHFITMIFGVALGITLCILYQFKIGIFIENLTPAILLLLFFCGSLRIYTLYIWKKNNLNSIFSDRRMKRLKY